MHNIKNLYGQVEELVHAWMKYSRLNVIPFLLAARPRDLWDMAYPDIGSDVACLDQLLTTELWELGAYLPPSYLDLLMSHRI